MIKVNIFVYNLINVEVFLVDILLVEILYNKKVIIFFS